MTLAPVSNSLHSAFAKSVDLSVTTVRFATLNVRFGHEPDRLSTVPLNVTGTGMGVGVGEGVGVGLGRGVGDGVGVGVGLGVGVGVGAGGRGVGVGAFFASWLTV